MGEGGCQETKGVTHCNRIAPSKMEEGKEDEEQEHKGRRGGLQEEVDEEEEKE